MILLLNFICSVSISLFRGWVISQLWLWYIVPQFEVKPLPILIAIGMSYIAGLFVPISLPSETPKTLQESQKVLMTAVGSHVIITLMALIGGWGYSLFL